MEEIKVIKLDIPHRGLNPNSNTNRFAKSNLTRTHRTNSKRETYKSLKEWGLPLGTFVVLSLKYVVYWKSWNYKRDDTNLIGSCKAYEDGIQDAVMQDDSTWKMEEPEHYVSPKNPRIEIQIKIEILI